MMYAWSIRTYYFLRRAGYSEEDVFTLSKAELIEIAQASQTSDFLRATNSVLTELYRAAGYGKSQIQKLLPRVNPEALTCRLERLDYQLHRKI